MHEMIETLRIPWPRAGRMLAWGAAVALLLSLASPVVAAGESVVFAAGNHILVLREKGLDLLAEIPVGKRVRDLAVDPARGLLYAAHSGGVQAFDALLYQPLGMLTEESAQRLTLGADGRTLYALAHPMHFTADGRRIPGEYCLQVIDLQAGKVKASIPMGYEVLDAVVDEARGRVFSLDRHARSLDVWSLADGGRLDRMAVTSDADPAFNSELFLLAIAPGGRRIYVPQIGRQALLFTVDAWSGSSRTMPLGGEVYVRDAAFSADGGTLYLLTLGELLAVDTAAGQVRAALPLEETFAGLNLSPDGRRLYLSNPVYEDGGGLWVYDAATLAPVEKTATPGLSLFVAAGMPAGGAVR